MKTIQFIFPLAILNFLTLILVSFGLPDFVPTHVNIYGSIDSFGSKWFIPLFGIVPIILIAIYILYLYYGESDINRSIEDKVIPAIAFLFIIISWIPVFLALGFSDSNNPLNLLSMDIFHFPIDIVPLILILLSVFFIFIGYFMESIKPNHFLGIRTPWTLKNDIVWKKTHKLGSYTYMIAGFILLVYALATFLSNNIVYSIIGLLLSIILVLIIPILYSYYKFNQIKN